MYVTIDSVMLQVQRYLHVNRQKETFAKSGRSLLKERAAVMQHIEKCIDVLDRPGKGWPLVKVTYHPENAHKPASISLAYGTQSKGSMTIKRGPYLLKKYVEFEG